MFRSRLQSAVVYLSLISNLWIGQSVASGKTQSKLQCTGAFVGGEDGFLTTIREDPHDEEVRKIYADFLDDIEREASAIVVRNSALLKTASPKERRALLAEIDANKEKALEEWNEFGKTHGLDKLGRFEKLTLEGLPSFRPKSKEALLEDSTEAQLKLIFGLELNDLNWTRKQLGQLIRLPVGHVTKLNLSGTGMGMDQVVILQSRALPIVTAMGQANVFNYIVNRPPTFGNLTEVNLSNTGMNDSAVAVLSGKGSPFTNVIRLDLSKNAIGANGARSLANPASPFKGVEELVLGWNRLGDDGVALLSAEDSVFRDVTYLHLYANRIGDTGVQLLAGPKSPFSKVTHLYLSYNEIGPAGAQAMAAKPSPFGEVTDLRLAGNNLGDAGVVHLTNEKTFKKVTHLDLNNNDIGPVGAGGLSRWNSPFAELTHLNLNDNELGPKGAKLLAARGSALKSLIDLRLGFNELGNTGVGHLSVENSILGNLTRLDLQGNEIGPGGAAYLAGGPFKRLRIVNLAVNQLDDAAAVHLSVEKSSLTQVEWLNLRQNRLTRSGYGSLRGPTSVLKGANIVRDE